MRYWIQSFHYLDKNNKLFPFSTLSYLCCSSCIWYTNVWTLSSLSSRLHSNLVYSLIVSKIGEQISSAQYKSQVMFIVTDLEMIYRNVWCERKHMLNCLLPKIASITTHSWPVSVYLMLLVVPRTTRRVLLCFVDMWSHSPTAISCHTYIYGVRYGWPYGIWFASRDLVKLSSR
jgi:hypothetical protein